MRQTVCKKPTISLKKTGFNQTITGNNNSVQEVSIFCGHGKFIKNILIIILFLSNNEVVFSQNIFRIDNEIAKNNMLNNSNSLEEIRVFEQSKILDYDNLPGTFWVMDEPVLIDGEEYFFPGIYF